ncbi:hypothetical protein TGDOM2_399890 [Toxoplasma gondii GAB2-2007-GAL-DOM2]|uniref:Uncharacterized protein n=1 Tax=Toxoplasma gondii GAB2-2007-GAL-DOM2 TaxID=1130820 RepID=A0A086J9L8_TOXGO|nr:hypothetical protein TGDOM2_399890 [Toxoplasma gondii GAB2-2007-GAL-DOM2]
MWIGLDEVETKMNTPRNRETPSTGRSHERNWAGAQRKPFHQGRMSFHENTVEERVFVGANEGTERKGEMLVDCFLSDLGYAVTPRQHIPHRSRTTPTVSRSRGRCAECGRRVFLLTEKAFKQKPRKRGGFENDSDADNRSAGERCKQDTPSGASCASLLLPGCLPLENPTSTHDSQEAVVACMYTACVCMRLGFPSAVCVRPQRPGVDLLLSL